MMLASFNVCPPAYVSPPYFGDVSPRADIFRILFDEVSPDLLIPSFA